MKSRLYPAQIKGWPCDCPLSFSLLLSLCGCVDGLTLAVPCHAVLHAFVLQSPVYECAYLPTSLCACVDIGCSQRSGLMSTGCCHTSLPLLINWLLVVDVFGALSSCPYTYPSPHFSIIFCNNIELQAICDYLYDDFCSSFMIY